MPSFLLLCVFEIFICRVLTAPEDILPTESKVSVSQKQARTPWLTREEQACEGVSSAAHRGSHRCEG